MTQAEMNQSLTSGETLHLPPPPTLYVEVYDELNLLLKGRRYEWFWQLNKLYAKEFIDYWMTLQEVCLRAENQGRVTIDETTLRFKLCKDETEGEFWLITKDEGSQTEEARIYPPNGPLRKLTIAFKNDDKEYGLLLAFSLQIEEGVISRISVKTTEKHPTIPGVFDRVEESLLINHVPPD